MIITLSPFKSSGNTSLLDLMLSFKSLENQVETELMNSMVYDQEFVIYWVKLMNKLHPNFCLVGNSFLQQSTLERLINSGIIELYICSDDSSEENLEKYKTGRMYQGMYNQLKKVCKNGVYLNEEPDGYIINNVITTEDLLKITLILWRETHMGEITDAIAKALSGVNSEVSQDEVKQAMANLGMPVENYTKQESKKSTPASDVSSTKKLDIKKDYINPPEPDEDDAGDDEICCKISGNNLVLMFPKGTEFKTVSVNGIDFDTLTVSLPDVSSTQLQVLSVVKEKSIVRVPIILNKKTTEKPKTTKTKSPATKPVQSSGDNIDVEKLRQKKAELDVAIKEARVNDDAGLIEDLRKQRRKIRNEINKLTGGAE